MASQNSILSSLRSRRSGSPEWARCPRSDLSRSRPLLQRLGFAEVRQKGSHKQFRHADGRGTTVPFHSGRDISPTLLRKTARTSASPPSNSSRATTRVNEKVVHGTGNVFVDLGFPDAAERQAKLCVAYTLNQLLDARKSLRLMRPRRSLRRSRTCPLFASTNSLVTPLSC